MTSNTILAGLTGVGRHCLDGGRGQRKSSAEYCPKTKRALCNSICGGSLETNKSLSDTAFGDPET